MVATALAAAVASALLTALIRRLALRGSVLDIPNARSSHTAPTPRGGGLAIVLVTTAALGILTVRGVVSASLMEALLGGGCAVALVGFIDDRRPLPAVIRLGVHFAAALWALACLGGLPPMQVGSQLLVTGWGGYLLGAVGIVWVLNLFNFMDGIDGLAASEALFIALGGAALGTLAGNTPEIASAAVVFAGACLGFLTWNWQPARIFLGDVGSGYLGYVIAVLALADARTHATALWVWLILGAVFFADATVTLVRRRLRGERVADAHRSHAYQWLARRWDSHRRVALAVLAINLGWTLPWAWVAIRHPRAAALSVLVALAPLSALALLAGAGRGESSNPAADYRSR
jgi:Fuc2NAc and GlcNAc transferase